MALLSILDRFRPAGAPGPAGPVGVPALDDQGPAAELAPVFAACAADVAESRALVEEAQQAAQRAVPLAREQAAAVLAQARLDGAADRATAAALVEQTTSASEAQVRAAAAAEAQEVADRSRDRIPALLEEIVDDVLTGTLTR